MKTLKEKALRLWKDESAQGATEYILLLVVVVAIAMIFRDKIKSAISSKMGQVESQINNFDQ